MTRPGAGLHALAARVCDTTTMERLIDPIVADLQLEYAEACRCGRRWHSRWIRMRWFFAFVAAIAMHGVAQSTIIWSTWPADDRREIRRVFAFSSAIATVGTLLLTLPFLTRWSIPHWHPFRLVLFLVPQAAPLAIPAGFTLGVVSALRFRARSARVIGVLMGTAMLCSLASLMLLASVIPAANQAFRVAAFGGHPIKGVNELTLREIARLLEPGGHEPMALLPPHDMRTLEVHLHMRAALSFATVVLVGFALALMSRRRIRRVAHLLVACAMFLVYYALMYAGVSYGVAGALPTFAPWLANVVFVVSSIVLLIAGQRPPSYDLPL